MGKFYGEKCPGCGDEGHPRESATPSDRFAGGYAQSRMCENPRCRVDFFHAKPPDHEVPE